MYPIRKILLACTLILGMAAFSSNGKGDTTEEIISRARSHLGGESNLKAIKSLIYEGRFETFKEDGEGTEKGFDGSIKIVLDQPIRQRQVVIREGEEKVTVVDNYDGWRSVRNPDNPDALQLQILGAVELKRLRANTFENLNFFSKIEKLHGVIINKGEVEKDGRTADLLVFKYAPDIYYERYFDAETGALIATVTDQGLEMKEDGEMIVNGVRFPNKVVSYANGKAVYTVYFDVIKVNEKIDDSHFEMPSFIPSKNKRDN